MCCKFEAPWLTIFHSPFNSQVSCTVVEAECCHLRFEYKGPGKSPYANSRQLLSRRMKPEHTPFPRSGFSAQGAYVNSGIQNRKPNFLVRTLTLAEGRPLMARFDLKWASAMGPQAPTASALVHPPSPRGHTPREGRAGVWRAPRRDSTGGDLSQNGYVKSLSLSLFLKDLQWAPGSSIPRLLGK